MPNDPYTPAPQDFNPADFLTQLGIAMTIMGQRDPAKATQLYMGLQESQRRKQIQQQKQATFAQDRSGLLTLADQIRQAMNTQFKEGEPTTGAEGLRPVEQTGFNQPEAVQGVIPKQLDPAVLLQLAAISPSAMKMQMDPQTQTYWQSLGIVPPTPQTLIGRQNADTSEHRAGIAEQIAGIRQQLANTAQQNAETSEGRLKLAQQIQNLETLMSQLQGANVQARTTNLGAKTGYTLGMTPLKQELTGELIKAMQAKYPTIAPMAQAQLEGQQGKNAEFKLMSPGKVEGQRLTNEGKRKKNAIIGTTKAGKPSESDKRVAAWVENYLHGEDFADQPGEKGWLSDSPAVSRREAAAADMKAELNPQLKDIKLRAYQEAFGGQRGGGAAPLSVAKPGEEVRVSPRTGKRFVNRNGAMVEVQ